MGDRIIVTGGTFASSTLDADGVDANNFPKWTDATVHVGAYTSFSDFENHPFCAMTATPDEFTDNFVYHDVSYEHWHNYVFYDPDYHPTWLIVPQMNHWFDDQAASWTVVDNGSTPTPPTWIEPAYVEPSLAVVSSSVTAIPEFLNSVAEWTGRHNGRYSLTRWGNGTAGDAGYNISWSTADSRWELRAGTTVGAGTVVDTDTTDSDTVPLAWNDFTFEGVEYQEFTLIVRPSARCFWGSNYNGLYNNDADYPIMPPNVGGSAAADFPHFGKVLKQEYEDPDVVPTTAYVRLGGEDYVATYIWVYLPCVLPSDIDPAAVSQIDVKVSARYEGSGGADGLLKVGARTFGQLGVNGEGFSDDETFWNNVLDDTVFTWLTATLDGGSLIPLNRGLDSGHEFTVILHPVGDGPSGDTFVQINCVYCIVTYQGYAASAGQQPEWFEAAEGFSARAIGGAFHRQIN